MNFKFVAILFAVILYNVEGFSIIKSEEMCQKEQSEDFLEYHFHTYFDANNRHHVSHAIKMRNEIISMCVKCKIIAIPLHYVFDPKNPILEHHNDTSGLNMGPIGPHPIGSFETWVPIEYFGQMYAWFIQNRGPLDIFIHPLTRHELLDHTKRAVFIGNSYKLNTDVLREEIPDFKSQYEYLQLGYAKPKSTP